MQRVVDVAVGENLTTFVDSTGKIYSWGRLNDKGQLGTDSLSDKP